MDIFDKYLRGASPRRHLRSFRQDSLQSGHPSDQLFTGNVLCGSNVVQAK
jgi:hypothetical protein